MKTNYNGFLRFIKFLQENDFLKYVVVIGSWAEYIYQQSGMLKGYTPSIRTLDVDLLIKNKMQPKEKISLPKAANENGFIVRQDPLQNTSKIYMLEENLEVEFLIEQKGSGLDPVIPTNIGVNAQALRHLSILSENTLTAKILTFEISVPTPEAYLLHKIIINQNRSEKRIKDQESIKQLFPYISEKEFEKLYNELPKKSKERADIFLKSILKVDIPKRNDLY
ncbi:MAG: GSU2403 family nucleotidyltransferase fold protein [Eubacteriales bacterium]|nr:GSU2403 family nucleotidyltransferase fold protein [Eubacteriales bacterium]